MTKENLVVLFLMAIFHIPLLSIQHELTGLSTSLRQLASAISSGQYTIECMLSSKNSDEPVTKKDRETVEDIILNGKIICSIPFFQWFNFPYTTPEINHESLPQGDIRSGIFKRVLKRKGDGPADKNAPISVDQALLYDYLFLIRDTDKIIAIGDGYLTSRRSRYPYLNIITNQETARNEILAIRIVHAIVNQSINIYVNNSRREDKDVMGRPLRFKMASFESDAKELIEYLNENNKYAKEKAIEISLPDDNIIEVKRRKGDKVESQKSIACSKEALL